MKLSKTVIGSVAALTLTVSAAFATVPAQTSSCSYQFNSNLRLGAVSTDVQNLQKLLNMDAATRVSVSGAGSAGAETLRFGPATLAAVKKFQAANGITPVSGYVGPLTRGVLNTICSTSAPVSTTNPTTNTGTGVVSNNIPVSVLVQKQASAKLGEFVVTGNGNVTVLELMRTGLSNNSTLAGVYLYDGATRLTDASSVLTDGTIRFASTAGLFSVSGSKTLTVRADIADKTSGQTVGVAMKSVTMMGGTATPVTGVNGPLFSISSADLIGANFSNTAAQPTQATSINAGSMSQIIWSNTLNISTNPALLKGIQFKMIGSAPSNALANVQLYVDGVSKGTASVNAMNQFVFDMSANPTTLTTGSHTVELRADVVAGAFRNFYISLENASDVKIEDSRLPGVFVTTTANNASFGVLNASTISINKGSFTATQDVSFNNTTSLVSGATNVKMAAFKFTAYGEDVKVTQVSFTPVFSVSTTTIQNVGLYVNGGQVSSNKTSVSGAFSYDNLGTNLLVPAGQTVTVEIRGDAVSTTSAANLSGTVRFNLTSTVAQGYSSQEVATSQSANGQQLTIASSNVTFAQTAGFAASTKAPNQAGVKIGSFTLQTGSAEGITVNQINVGVAGNMGNQLTNLTVKDGSTVLGAPVGSISSTNAFSTNVSVPMSTTKVFDVYADIGSVALNATASASMTLTFRGATSNLSTTQSNSGTPAVTTVNVATVGTTTLVAASSPVAQLVVAGQSALGIATFNLKTSNGVGGAVAKDITFTVPTNTIGSVTVNGKTASVVGTTATVYDAGISIPSDASGVNVPVTVSLVCANTSAGCSGVSSSTVALTLASFTYNNGTEILTNATSSVSATHLMVASKPTVTVTQSSTGGLTDGNVKIGEITVSADAAGDIEITQLPVVVSNNGLTTVNNICLKDSTGSSVIIGDSTACGTTGTNGSASIAASGNLSFNTAARKIAKGTSETYTVFANIVGSTGTANTKSVTFKLGTAANFLWNDVLGNANGIGGGYIYNYPTNSQTKSN